MKLPMALVICVAVAGCSDMNNTQQRALSGTAIGAGAGAILGAIGGNAGLGAIAGAGAGLAGGLIYDKVKNNEQTAYRQGYSAGAHSRPPPPPPPPPQSQ
jgi:uncharacterized protein YcfJ